MYRNVRDLTCAGTIQADIMEYEFKEKYEYIFISSGSVSLFTDMSMCRSILSKLKELLAPTGKFIFAVDTIANRCENDNEYKTSITVKTKRGYDLILKSKNRYDEQSQTQFSPGIYELYSGKELLQSEPMAFQTHLYRFGEMEQYLAEIGFTEVKTYSSFSKDIAINDKCEMFLFESNAEAVESQDTVFADRV